MYLTRNPKSFFFLEILKGILLPFFPFELLPYIYIYIFAYIYIWPKYAVYRISVSQPGIRPVPLAVEAQSLDLWTVRNVSRILNVLI